MYCNVPEQQFSLLHRHWPLAVCLHLLVEAAVRVRSPSQRGSKILYTSQGNRFVNLFSLFASSCNIPGERFKGLVALCHSFWYTVLIIFNNHSHSTIIHSFILHHSPRPVFLYPHRFFAQQEKNLHGVPSRGSKACLTASRRTTKWATPHPTELRRTPLSYAAPRWATPHPPELRRTPGKDILFSKISIIYVSTINRYLSVQCTV